MEDYAKDMGMNYDVSFMAKFDTGSVEVKSGNGAYDLGHQQK